MVSSARGSTPVDTGSCSPLADALAPGLLLAQAIGRVGNYFNQELYGRPTDLPWGLEIDSAHWPPGMTFPVGTTFHPTFLYEALWNLAGIALLLYLDRRLRLGYGRAFAVYVMIYTAGRGWIESLRIDAIELDDVLGLRWGVWMSVILFVGAAAYFVVVGRRHRPPNTREPSPYVEPQRTVADDSRGNSVDDSRDDSAAGSPDASRERDQGAERMSPADDAEAPQRSQTPPE